jgi:glycosyltransferase involved in cell wall biosynthesis
LTTAFIIDPALRHFAGHHHAAVVGWVDAARICGLNVRILAHRECLFDTIEIFLIERIFGSEFYELVSKDPEHIQRRFHLMNCEFRNDAARPLEQVCADDVLILDHANRATLSGIGAWAAEMPRDRLPRLVVWMMTAPEDDQYSILSESTSCAIAAIDWLRNLFADRLILLGSTADITDRYNALECGLFRCLPFLALRCKLLPRKPRPVGSPPVVAVLGDLWARKGLQFLPSVIRQIAAQAIDVRWMIAGRCVDPDSIGLEELMKLASTVRNVDVIVNSQGIDNYEDRLLSADLALLSYSPDYYALRGSGIAEEAEVLGIPYVAPNVAFSEAAVSAGAVRTFAKWTADGVVMAVSNALRELPDLSNCAQQFARERSARVREIRQTVLSEIFQNGANLS